MQPENTSPNPDSGSAQTAIVAEEDFRKLIEKRAGTLLGLANYLSRCQRSSQILIRPLLGELLSQSIQVEELLDAYNARNNYRWCPFRSVVAAVKLFSDVTYELLHIRHVLPAYRLMPINSDFVEATKQTLSFTGDILLSAAKLVLQQAEILKLAVPTGNAREKSYVEELPQGRLPYSCQARNIETAAETVTSLATAFLNLAAESKDVRVAGRAKPQEYADYLENIVKEEKLRSHISIVFHLLRTATLFTHHYERHLKRQSCESPTRPNPLVKPEALLHVLMTYSVNHISLYITSAENLCRQILRRYAEIARIQVPVPRYRGFHVRPSTLIAKLILHYGSTVRMELDGHKYDAGKPLELFRANEQINAQKRRWLAAEIERLQLARQGFQGRDISAIIRGIVLTLAEQGKVILYEQPLQLSDEQMIGGANLFETVSDEVATLLALGKIDINTDLTATFVGDKRVLADIKLLAESGYGEDNFGNNTPLPEKLKYLRL